MAEPVLSPTTPSLAEDVSQAEPSSTGDVSSTDASTSEVDHKDGISSDPLVQLQREGLVLKRRTSRPRISRTSLVRAVQAIERLDPASQTFNTDELRDELSHDILLPGLIPLAPLTLINLLLITTAMTCTLIFAFRFLVSYTIPFALAHVILLSHLWAYHTAYHQRRRFMAFRQVVFMTLMVAFMSWMIIDLQRFPRYVSPNGRADRLLNAVFWCNLVMNIILGSHWLILGRGRRRVISID